MKKQAMSFTLPAVKPKTRAHWVLFAEDTPFKPKSERNKMGWRRRDKHQKDWYEA